MVLGFKKQFVPLIENGTKIHTIREDKHERWKAGRSIQFATGVRTRHYNKFRDGECHSVQQVEIEPMSRTIKVDGIEIDPRDHGQFAKCDGFPEEWAFWDWFNKPLKGKLIHWTEFQYNSN